MREILKTVNLKVNPEVSAIITKSGISFSCNGNHLLRMTTSQIKTHLENPWYKRLYDSFYFSLKGEDFYISDVQFDIVCAEQLRLEESQLILRLKTFDSEEIRLINNSIGNLRGVKSRKLNSVIRAISDVTMFRSKYAKAL